MENRYRGKETVKKRDKMDRNSFWVDCVVGVEYGVDETGILT